MSEITPEPEVTDLGAIAGTESGGAPTDLATIPVTEIQPEASGLVTIPVAEVKREDVGTFSVRYRGTVPKLVVSGGSVVPSVLTVVATREPWSPSTRHAPPR